MKEKIEEMSEFKLLLKNSKITQNDMAKSLGVHQTLVSQWCCGKGKPSIIQTAAIAKLLGVSVEEVIKCFVN